MSMLVVVTVELRSASLILSKVCSVTTMLVFTRRFSSLSIVVERCSTVKFHHSRESQSRSALLLVLTLNGTAVINCSCDH
eukprot:3940925-Rhodomonas_salina.1